MVTVFLNYLWLVLGMSKIETLCYLVNGFQQVFVFKLIAKQYEFCHIFILLKSQKS